MSHDKEENIKTEAYRRWEAEGRQHGDHDRHWREAARALESAENDVIDTEGKTIVEEVSEPDVSANSKGVEAPIEMSKRIKSKKN